MCYTADLTQIPFVKLHNAGFKGIVFDKDNTLTSPSINKLEIHARIKVCNTINNVNRRHSKSVREYLEIVPSSFQILQDRIKMRDM